MTTFFERVYNVIACVPYGNAVSYGQIARVLGNPRAARQVGWACASCPEHLPWQRVVMADGAVSGGAFADMRRFLLESEGVTFLPDGRVDMDVCGMTDAQIRAALDARLPDHLADCSKKQSPQSDCSEVGNNKLPPARLRGIGKPGSLIR